MQVVPVAGSRSLCSGTGSTVKVMEVPPGHEHSLLSVYGLVFTDEPSVMSLLVPREFV